LDKKRIKVELKLYQDKTLIDQNRIRAGEICHISREASVEHFQDIYLMRKKHEKQRD
jgi:hypothetical protein